jgi:hypothetical protein
MRRIVRAFRSDVRDCPHAHGRVNDEQHHTNFGRLIREGLRGIGERVAAGADPEAAEDRSEE